jgi:hypothetical protein
MAYMNQETKKAIAPVVKNILKKYGVKGTLGVRNHSTLVLNITEGKIDFLKDYFRNNDEDRGYISVNRYWFHEHFDGVAKACLSEVIEVMNSGNWNNSRIEVDYFDVGWYVDVNIGKWDKPYKHIEAA